MGLFWAQQDARRCTRRRAPRRDGRRLKTYGRALACDVGASSLLRSWLASMSKAQSQVSRSNAHSVADARILEGGHRSRIDTSELHFAFPAQDAVALPGRRNTVHNAFGVHDAVGCAAGPER